MTGTELAHKFETGHLTWAGCSREAQNAISRHFMRHFYPVIMRLSYGTWKDDLAAAGNLGLARAFARFVPQDGVKFITYADACVQGEIMDEWRRQDFLPRWVRDRVKKLDRARMRLRALRGHEPSREEAAAEAGFSEKDVEDVDRYSEFSTMDAEDVADESGWGDPEAALLRKELLAEARRACRKLTKREKQVLALLMKGLPQFRIAETLGVHETRVSQLRKNMERRLREALTA